MQQAKLSKLEWAATIIVASALWLSFIALSWALR